MQNCLGGSFSHAQIDVRLLALGTRTVDGSFGSLLGQQIGHDLLDFFELLDALSLCTEKGPLTTTVTDAALKQLDSLPDPEALGTDGHVQLDEPTALPPRNLSDIPHMTVLPDDLTEMKLCFVGDTGSGRSGQVSVANMMEAESCTHVFILGDVIYGHGLRNWDSRLLKLCGNRWYTRADEDWMFSECSRFRKKFLNPYKSLLDNGTQFFVVAGNHDYGVRSLGVKIVSLSRFSCVFHRPDW